MMAYSGEKVFRQRAFKVPIVDPVGAGDVFGGVFVSGVSERMEGSGVPCRGERCRVAGRHDQRGPREYPDRIGDNGFPEGPSQRR